MSKKKGPLLKVRGVHKAFSKNEVLRGVDCDVEAGTVFGVVGPNGAGKTTLIRILATLLRAKKGKFSINKVSPSRSLYKYRRLVGYCPDRLPIDGKVLGYDFLDFFARINGKGPSVVEELLALAELEDAAYRPVASYSKGMMKRMSLARTLLTDPVLFLLDEPTSGLDPAGQRKIQNLILSMDKVGKAVLLSSHNLYEVERVCDQILLLKDGRLEAVDSVSDLFEEDDMVIIDMVLRSVDDALVDAVLGEFEGLKLLSKGKHKVRFTTERAIEKERLVAFVQEKGGEIVGVKYL